MADRSLHDRVRHGVAHIRCHDHVRPADKPCGQCLAGADVALRHIPPRLVDLTARKLANGEPTPLCWLAALELLQEIVPAIRAARGEEDTHA